MVPSCLVVLMVVEPTTTLEWEYNEMTMVVGMKDESSSNPMMGLLASIHSLVRLDHQSWVHCQDEVEAYNV